MTAVRVEGVLLVEQGDMVVRASRTRWDNHFEPQSMAAWRKSVEPGSIALDVGAYTGVYAIAAAQEGASVVAADPNPAAVARLRANLDANGVGDHVAVHQVAVGWYRGRVRLEREGAPLTSATKVSPRGDGELRMVPGSDLVPEHAEVSAVKVDVEGMEVEALIGLADVLHRWRPFLLVEALDEHARRRVLGYLDQAGFSYAYEAMDGRNVAVWL